MSLDTNKYSKEEWIEFYFFGKLTDLQRQEFETAMQQDPSLMEEVELRSHIISGFRHKGEVAVLEELKTISSEEELRNILQQAEAVRRTPVATVKKRFHSLWYRVGAVAVILVFLFIGYQPRYTSSDLYMEYHRIPEYEYFPSRGGLAYDSLQPFMALGEVYYENGEYAEALYEFEKVISALPEADVPEELWYYSAVCLMETGQTDRALKRWQLLIHCEECELQPDAQWQMVWGYMKLEQRKEAQQMLADIISAGSHKYTGQAEEVLDKLNKRRWF